MQIIFLTLTSSTPLYFSFLLQAFSILVGDSYVFPTKTFGGYVLGESFWDTLQSVVTWLKPLRELIVSMQKDSMTLAAAVEHSLPIFNNLIVNCTEFAPGDAKQVCLKVFSPLFYLFPQGGRYCAQEREGVTHSCCHPGQYHGFQVH